VQNVPYIARGVQALVSATIGTGIEPRFDGADAERLNAAWAEWEKVADADAIFDLYGLQAAAYRAMVQDGEVLVRRRTRRPGDGLPVPLQLQLLEIDWLDSGKNSTSRAANTIISGIEYDALGKPAAYWLYDQHPGDARGWLGRAGQSKRVPAADIIHLFAPTRPGQGRGITQLASVIARTRDLSLYEDAELQRKNLETRLGLVVSGDASALESGITAYGSAVAPGDASSDRKYGDLGVLPSGGITELPPGLTATSVEPKAAPGYVETCKFNLHLIAAGVGVPYESMTGDMVEVNFSSARIRQIEFRRDVEQEQWLVVIPRLCERIAAWFVDAASLVGKAGTGKRTVDWSTPRWDYVNPAQDVAADIDAISAGLLSPSEALRRRGYKPELVFAELGKDFEAMQASGALGLMQFLMAKGGGAASANAAATAANLNKQGA
jgi:lambda family phage portal protein